MANYTLTYKAAEESTSQRRKKSNRKVAKGKLLSEGNRQRETN